MFLRFHVLLCLIILYKDILDGTLHDCTTELVKLDLNADVQQYLGKSFPVPIIHIDTLNKELTQIINEGHQINYSQEEQECFHI